METKPINKRETKERLPGLFPEDEQRGGSREGQGFEERSLRAFSQCTSCER